MPRLVVHGFTISLAILLLSCSSENAGLIGSWSGNQRCSGCHAGKMEIDGPEGDLHFEFERGGVYNAWEVSEVARAMVTSGAFRVEGDSLYFKQNAASAWSKTRILLLTADSVIFEVDPLPGCVCTQHYRRDNDR